MTELQVMILKGLKKKLRANNLKKNLEKYGIRKKSKEKTEEDEEFNYDPDKKDIISMLVEKTRTKEN